MEDAFGLYSALPAMSTHLVNVPCDQFLFVDFPRLAIEPEKRVGEDTRAQDGKYGETQDRSPVIALAGIDCAECARYRGTTKKAAPYYIWPQASSDTRVTESEIHANDFMRTRRGPNVLPGIVGTFIDLRTRDAQGYIVGAFEIGWFAAYHTPRAMSDTERSRRIQNCLIGLCRFLVRLLSVGHK